MPNVAEALTPLRRLSLHCTQWRQSLAGSCAVCADWARGGLCEGCRQHFAAPRPRCERCALPLPTAAPLCGACLHETPPWQRCFCIADYAFPWDRLVHRLKFEQSPELAPLLADLLRAAVDRQPTTLPQAFVPVPLSAARLAERGYDQAWQLARALGRNSNRPAWPRALERRFDARPQTRLSRRERRDNLRGAFVPGPPPSPPLPGCHLALVDDVLTTGATASEATRTLLAAGAARVDLWVLARTPAPAAD